MPTLSKKELDAIIDEVATALNGAAVVEAAKLSKAHDGEDTSAEVSPDASATTPPADDSASASPAPSDSAPPSDGPPPGDASASPTADASAAPPADGSAPTDPTNPAADAGGQGVDPRELEAAYAALPLEELKMHFMAAKCAFVAAMGNDPAAADPSAQAPGPDAGAAPAPGADASVAPPPGPDAGAGSPPPGPDASATPPPPADDNAPALKTEMGSEIPHDTKADGENPLESVKKSEKDKAIASLGTPRKTATDEAIVSLSKSDHDRLVTAIKNFVESPVRKSLTSTSQVTRPTGEINVESMTKNEVLTALKKVAEKPTLSKADRSAINSYALNLVKVDAVKYLLTP